MFRKKAIKTFLEKSSLQILIMATLIGVGLRWIYIGHHSFWYDESFSGLTARLNLEQILANAALDVHPPGYYLILHYWLYLGQSEAIIRSLSALFSIAAVLLIYGLGRWLFDRVAAGLAALGLAIILFQVYVAQEARMYGLVVFLSVVFFLSSVFCPLSSGYSQAVTADGWVSGQRMSERSGSTLGLSRAALSLARARAAVFCS